MMKNLIFDWSGVVKDSTLSQLWIVNRIFKSLGAREIDLQEFRETWTQPYMLFYNKHLPGVNLEEEQKIYKESLFHKDCPKAGAYPGIVELLKELKSRDFFMAAISSDLPETLLVEIGDYGLENVFNEVITDVHDKRDALAELTKKYNFKPEETVFIGDSNHEIEAGKEAGIKTIAVSWGYCSRPRLEAEKPDWLVDKIEELAKVIDN